MQGDGKDLHARDLGGEIEHGKIVKRLHGQADHGLFVFRAVAAGDIAVRGELGVEIQAHGREAHGGRIPPRRLEVFVMRILGHVVEVESVGVVARELIRGQRRLFEWRDLGLLRRSRDLLFYQADQSFRHQGDIEQHGYICPSPK